MTNDEVLDALRAAVPEFAPEIQAHIAFHDAELPHLLFGDLTRFVLAAHGRGDHELVGRCLAWLDTALRDGDADVQNLVAVSFVENVGPWEPDVQSFIATWPSALRSEADQQRR